MNWTISSRPTYSITIDGHFAQIEAFLEFFYDNFFNNGSRAIKIVSADARQSWLQDWAITQYNRVNIKVAIGS